jgi:type II secretory pathway predicted ATPase ExeA
MPAVKAFQPAADPRFLWLGAQHGEVLGRLREGVLGGAPVLVLTGEAGTGKTLLARTLVAGLREAGVLAAWLDYPSQEPADLHQAIAERYRLSEAFAGRGAFHASLQRLLADLHGRRGRAVLVVEEAQSLGRGVVAEIGHIAEAAARLAGEAPSVLSILLVGQPELLVTLDGAEGAPAARQVAVRCALDPLTEEQVDAYVRHRLQVAGGEPESFSRQAIRTIWQESGGVPRLVNWLCDRALQAAGEGGAIVDERLVRDALDGPGGWASSRPGEGTPARRRATLQPRWASRRPPRRRVGALAVAGALLGMGAVGYLSLPRPSAGPADPLGAAGGPAAPAPLPPPEPRPQPAPSFSLPVIVPPPLAHSPAERLPSTDAPEGAPGPEPPDRPAAGALPPGQGNVIELPPRGESPASTTTRAPAAATPSGPAPAPPPVAQAGPAMPPAATPGEPSARRPPVAAPPRIAPAPGAKTPERAAAAPSAPAASRPAPEPAAPPPATPEPASVGRAVDEPDPRGIIDWLLRESPARGR